MKKISLEIKEKEIGAIFPEFEKLSPMEKGMVIGYMKGLAESTKQVKAS